MRKCSLWVLLIVSNFVQAADWELVTSSDSTLSQLPKEVLADLYLGQRKSLPDGTRITVYDRKDRTLREAFYQDTAGLTLLQLRAYWAKRVFTGKGRPPKQLTEDELSAALTANPNAIGLRWRGSADNEALRVLRVGP